MYTVVVTGCSRGLGLEWVRQFAIEGWRVYATCRYPQQAGELKALAGANANITLHTLDVTRGEDVAALVKELSGETVDVLINNAGVYHERWGRDRLGQINYSQWQESFEVNTLTPLRISEALIDNVARGKRRLIVSISSHMGSITDIGAANDYAYRSSKAALNAAMKGLSFEVASRGVGVLLLHPGWVRTRMGGASAPLSAGESVAAMRGLIERFTPAQSGGFYRYDGSVIPW